MTGKYSDATKKILSEKMMGNKNQSRRKPFYDMLDRKIKQDPKKLERIVLKLLDAAEDGESFALSMVADRLDGKAVQIQEISGVDGNAIEIEGASAFANELMAELLRNRQERAEE